MQIILTDEVKGVGRAGEIVNVKDGYGRNYLLPNKLAVPATSNNLKALEHEKKVIADKQNKKKREAEKVAKGIEALSCSIPCQVGEEGKLFGSVTTIDIEKFLKEKGIDTVIELSVLSIVSTARKGFRDGEYPHGHGFGGTRLSYISPKRGPMSVIRVTFERSNPNFSTLNQPQNCPIFEGHLCQIQPGRLTV